MRRPIWTSTGLAGLVLIAMLGCAELAARHEGFGRPLLYQAAPAGYEPVPGQRIDRLGKTTNINTLGTRGHDVTPMPAPGTWRIMVLGDSVANGGSQLGDAQTFPAVASQSMQRAGCPNEILNASAGGWSLFDEAAWLKQHGLAGATMLVWTINALDLDQPPSTAATLDHNPSFPSHLPATALGEILFRYALPRLGLGTNAADNGSVANQQFSADQFEAVSKLVTATKRDMDQRGVRMIILFHDVLPDLPPVRDKARTRFLLLLQTHGIPVIETKLNREPNARRFYLDTIHPNAIGAERVGILLATHLRQDCPHSSK